MEESRERRSFLDILSEVEQDDALSRGDASEEQPSRDVKPSSGEGTGGLGMLLSNPELLAKLPGLLRVVQSLTEPPPKQEASRPESPEALLCALRPYLNDSRRQALDAMIRVSRLSASLKTLK